MPGFRASRIGGLPRRIGLVATALAAGVGWPGTLAAEVSRTAFHAERGALSERLRATGALPGADAVTLEARIRAALDEASLADRAGLLYDLGAVRRLRQDYAGALDSYTAAIAAAGPADGAIVFDAWVGIARTNAYGLDDHGAAAAALEQAAAIAGPSPPRAMAHDLDAFAAEIASIRGDAPEALIRNLAAGITAETPVDRFYVLFDRGSIFEQFGIRCDHEPLIDAKTFEEEPFDLWGGCFRALDAARDTYQAARALAVGEGWDGMAGIIDGMLGQLEFRGRLIRMNLDSAETIAGISFDGGTVLFEERFPTGASLLEGDPMLTGLLGAVADEADPSDPRTAWLRGAQADVAGDGAAALQHFTQAAELLAAERASYFDLRRTGTMTEEHPEVARDLALRLLNQDRDAEALAVFETLRAQGMSAVHHAFASLDLTAAERAVTADLLEAEARLDAERAAIVQAAIITPDLDPAAALASIRALQDDLRDLQQRPETATVLARLRAVPPPPPVRLADLEAAVRDSGVPVLLYWTTPTNVVVWAVTGTGSAPRSVFLPQTALLGHVERILRGTESRFAPYPADSARALYAYLVDPVQDLLPGDEVLIVPQGPLVGLPFEALVDPESGRYLVEGRAVSYAPNVDFALRALAARPVALDRLVAVVDPEIATGEVDRLPAGAGLQVHASDALDRDEALAALSDAPVAHVLLHGRFGRHDPLLSTLDLGGAGGGGAPRELTAASLVAADWRATRLAVLSACEGAVAQVRLSGEVYGLGWPLLVGGAETLVLSRWRVEGTTNADWISDFYADLGATGRPARAAAVASRLMIGRGMDHPFFWAGPQVIGR
jgi:CHAT domain-containing protein